MITSKDLAKLAGVSQSTVSRALNDSPLISDPVKGRIKKLAREQGFSFNSQAKGLKTKRTDTVALILPKHFKEFSHNLFYTRLLDLYMTELSRYGWDILILHNNSTEDEEHSELSNLIMKNKVDGFIIFQTILNNREIQYMRDTNTPYVELRFGRKKKGVKLADNIFYLDTYEASHLAGKFIAEHWPYKDILRIDGYNKKTNDTIPEKLEGFRDGLKEGGYKGKMTNIFTGFNHYDAYETVIRNKDLIHKGMLIKTDTDIMAFSIISAIYQLGYRIPEDIEVMGNDDIPMAQWVKPKLSTVHMPLEDVTEYSSRALYKIINKEPVDPVPEIGMKLVLRETTKPLP